MTLRMRVPCILTIYALLLCGTLVLSLEDPNQDTKINIRSIRKRINEYGEITEDAKNDIENGRKYLESLWDSVEKNYERKLEKGRMRYLESMMGMLPMSMSLPTKAPSQSPPSIPNEPIEVHSPTIPPVKGPTLPTREPIPTKAPIPAPSTRVPIQLPTPAPFKGTSPPTRFCVEANKENVLFETLSEITERSKLLDIDTPQGKAYAFLLKEKPSYVCSPTLIQRYGLTTFYFAMGGASWTNSGAWLGDKQECNWYGVDCDGNKFSTSLNLAVNNLRGKIPHEISALTTLQNIDLFFNSITGSLPDGFSGLQSLATLDLQQNLLTGLAFPASITDLTQLESYRISNNDLSGEIVTQIGFLRNLKELWAGHNAIFGTIPSDIGDLRKLKTIFLNNNALKGKIPTELGLIPMESLVLNDNNFLGTIPMQLFNIASLDTIRLDNNFLEGTLPDAIGQLTDLENLRVENNNLSGQIPMSIGSMTSLVNLRLNNNFWSGTVPDVFENYKQLDFFDISDSQIEGPIPKTIFSIPTLRLAYMSNCGLTGTIPPQYADPPNLRDLYLDSNKITGTIPEIASGQLEKLSEFLVQDNKISGTMPDSICALRSDFVLDDLWTDCGGPLPEIECDFPECCNRCFEAQISSTGRKKKRQL